MTSHEAWGVGVYSYFRDAAVKANTNQFTQMEANFSLFWGLAVNAWIQILVPDELKPAPPVPPLAQLQPAPRTWSNACMSRSRVSCASLSTRAAGWLVSSSASR